LINAIPSVVIPVRQSLLWRLLPTGLLISLVLLGVLATAISGALPGFVDSLVWRLIVFRGTLENLLFRLEVEEVYLGRVYE